MCSGIEAASVAWKPLGWECAFLSEIDPFCRAVLSHHYPEVTLHGDFTQIENNGPAIDVLVGGTPCQSFSVAGLRGGMADQRGNLALEFCRLADRLRPRWITWENVPGVLSSNRGRDFGSILGALGELGYGTAYRILDAQYFGVPQRRRRVFVVGYLGDWRRAAAVLFERQSLSGDSPPRRKTGERTTGSLAARTSAGGGLGTDFDCAGGVIPILEAGARTGKSTTDIRAGAGIGNSGDPMFTLQSGKQHGVLASTGQTSHCLNAGGMGRIDYETETLVTHSLRADGFDASEDGTGRGTPLVSVPALRRDIGMFTCDCGNESVVSGIWSDETEDWEPDWKTCPACKEFRPGSVTYFDRMHETVSVFDPNQITSNVNRYVPYPGICHTLPGSSNAPVAFRASGQEGFTPSGVCPPISATDGGGAGVPTIAFTCKDNGADAGDISPILRAMEFDGSHANGGGQVAIAFNLRGREGGAMPEMSDLASMRSASGGSSRSYVATSAVRRLTPLEAERLQGFPDGYTDITYRKVLKSGKLSKRIYKAADDPRYCALGNSMAVPCMRWIGERIQMVDSI